jgi:hypothetical protein
MDAFHAELDRLGRRLRARGALRRASRAALAAAVLACAVQLVARLAGLPLPAAALPAALGVAVGLLFLRELLRPFGRPAAAAALDRLLGLEERLSTALEASGPLRGLQSEDAARALSTVRLPGAPPPLEAKLAGAAVLVLFGLAALPSFRAREDAGTVRVREVLRAEAERLLAAAPDSAEVREAAQELPGMDPERAAARLEALRKRLAERMLAGGEGSEAAKRALDAATAAAEGLGAELGGQGRAIHASSPVVAEAKLRRRLEEPAPVEAGRLPPTTSAALVSKRDWDRTYDTVVLTYFRGMP